MQKYKGMTLNKKKGPDFVRTSPSDPYRNVEQIRASGMRVVRGTVPASVRKELADAVRAGWLGRIRKNGLAPEIYFHPDHVNGAIERHKKEFEYGAQLIAQVCV